MTKKIWQNNFITFFVTLFVFTHVKSPCCPDFPSPVTPTVPLVKANPKLAPCDLLIVAIFSSGSPFPPTASVNTFTVPFVPIDSSPVVFKPVA